MKVLNVTASMDPVTGGGVAERTLQITRAMNRLGAKAGILTTDLGLSAEYLRKWNDIEITTLPCLVKRFYFPGFSYRRVKELVAASDIVNIMGYWTVINVLAYYAAKDAGKPYTVCPAGALPIYGRSKLIKRLYNLAVGRKMISEADMCVAVSKNEFIQFKDYGVNVEKILLIPNGVNHEDFIKAEISDFRKKYSLGQFPFLLFVGRLNFIKGPDILLKAFVAIKDNFPDYHLVFAGPDGGMLHNLKDMSSEAHLNERVHFIGHIEGEDKSAAYHAAELLVIPSRQEAMSIVVLEAGICGTPVLLTDQCGFDEVATVEGGIVIPASVEGISNGIKAALLNRGNLKKMGLLLLKYVQAGFTWRIAAEKYLQASGALINNRKA